MIKKGFTKWHGYDIKVGISIEKCPFCYKNNKLTEQEGKGRWVIYISCSCSPDVITDWYYKEGYINFLDKKFPDMFMKHSEKIRRKYRMGSANKKLDNNGAIQEHDGVQKLPSCKKSLLLHHASIQQNLKGHF